MNTLTETSGAHALDGSDPDASPGPRGQAARLVDDLRELEAMSESDLKHYTGTPSFSQKSKTRGANGY